MRPVFTEQELVRKGSNDSISPEIPGTPIFDSPITTKENMMLALNGEKPLWYPMVGMIGGDYKPLRPRIFPENYLARYIMDGEPPVNFDDVPFRQPGWFDTTWEYIPVAGGPMVVPGTQKIEDMNDWEQLTFPNLDDYDWEGSARANEQYVKSNLPIEFGIPTSYWERLMSILEVAEAAMAIIDEDQIDACHAFFEKLTVFYIDYVERVHKYYHADMVLMHDDWGHQNGLFFSPKVCQEMIIPYLKRVIDRCHTLGMRFELHCCGKAQDLVPLMIEAGVDLWCPQPMNDCKMLVEKYQGQGILFGIELPIVTPQMTDEEIYALATEFVETYGDASVAYVNYGCNMKLYEYIYKLSRQVLTDN